MASIIYCVLFLFFTNIFVDQAKCELPAYIQNLQLDDITSLIDKFPAILVKIKEAVNRFRCPKGWRRLGGSCFYLSEVKSTAAEANATCNELHSNNSNLMQIRNAVELFYAAHVLTKHNLSSMIVNFDPKLFKGKTITDILMDDQGRWQRMKDKFKELRIRYYKLKAKILRELEEAGLRISRRSKKIKQKIQKHTDKYKHEHETYYHDYNDYLEDQTNITNPIITNDTQAIEEYEYDNLDSEDEEEEFEQLDDVHDICDQVDWNVYNNDSTVYVLTTYLIEDRVVCSLSNIEPHIEYDHVCEYVLDFCFANVVCGKHGHCVNTLSGFKCSCSFLYGGLLCEKISKQGYQILISIGLVLLLYGLSLKPIRWVLKGACTGLFHYYRRRNRERKKNKKIAKDEDDERILVPTIKEEDADEENDDTHRPSIVEELWDYFTPAHVDPLKGPNKRDLIRSIWVSGLLLFFLLLLFTTTTLIHYSSFKYEINDDTKFETIVNETIRLVSRCERISNSRHGNLVFFPVAISLIIVFSWSVKRERKCKRACDGRPGLIPPIEPFRTSNRFTTATVFGILSFEVLKIFEELLFTTVSIVSGGVLIELIERLAMVILVGLRYYPVLASLQLRNVMSRLLIALYIIGDIVFAIIREGSCMGFIPLSRYYSAFEEAKLRMELGTWFIVYGLIKITPHFIFLSYIAAELCVRFGYDSIYVPIKKKQTIWTAPVVQTDEIAFAKFYVTKLFRRNLKARRKEYEAQMREKELAKQGKKVKSSKEPSRVKKFMDSIYRWDEDFRYTTLATCTYTVAVVFLYYLACTFVFLYISRTTGHISFVRHYLESTLNMEFRGFFSLRQEIIFSAIIAFLIYAGQLFLGMQNYKKHKMDLYKGIYDDVPSATNFKANSIVSKSAHYSGFLVGYMAWGFLISFHLILVVLSFIRIISFQMRYVELILAITVPVIVVYLLKMVSASSAGTLCFMQIDGDKVNLNNRKTYAVFLYFNFFADCFLGIASCIIRFVKATCLNLVYMARLDCSFLGRPIERFDLGYASYVSYLHMEVAHTNPILLAFCYTLYDDIIQRGRKHCYDDECCIGPGELLDEEEQCDTSTSIIEKPSSSKDEDRQKKGSSSKKPQISRQESASSGKSSKDKRPPIATIEEDEHSDHKSSIKEVRPKSKSPSPSGVSDKSSQKSKSRKVTVKENIKEEDEEGDGGRRVPTISTIARLIPEEQPRLPAPSAPIPDVPIREDLRRKKKGDDDDDDDDDDNFDDDGGLKPPSISTISTIMPKQQPHLMPIQGKSPPPPIPKRSDIIDEEDEDDDDGGINPAVIAKKKKELEEKKKKKEQEKLKKKSIIRDQDEDDDGGVRKPSPKEKPKKNPVKPVIFEDEDEDGGVSKQKQLAADKKKKQQDEAKKKKEQKKALKAQDDDEDEDGGVKRKEPTKKKKESTKTSSKTKVVKDSTDGFDDDGGRVVKTYDTIRTIMPPQRPVLDTTTKKSPSPEINDDGSMRTLSKKTVQPLLASYDTVGRIVPNVSVNSRGVTQESNYDVLPTDEERARRANVIYSTPLKDTVPKSNDIPILRTTSYREAQQSTPPTSQRKTKSGSSTRSGSNTNEESSHYSEITDDAVQPGIINRSYSHSGSIQSASNHSIKQYSKHSSAKTLKEEQHTEESAVTTEQEDEGTTEDDKEEQEEEEEEQNTDQTSEDEEEGEEEKPKERSMKKQATDLSKISTAFPTISHLANPKEAARIEKARRRKQARFRWFLAYTIINNYHLFDLRKGIESRLAQICIQRGVISENAEPPKPAAAPAVAPQAFAMTEMSHSPGSKPFDMQPRTLFKKRPETPDVPKSRSFLNVPDISVNGGLPASPAERYIAIRSFMLYDVNASHTPNAPPMSAAALRPSGVSARAQMGTSRSRSPNTPSSSINELKVKRPPYQRQESQGSSSTVVTGLNNTPNFQSIPESGISTDDYALPNKILNSNSTTLRSQMTHAQHMQMWHQKQAQKGRKKHPYRYSYGQPPPRPADEKVSTSAILTPQIIAPNDRSHFHFPPQTKNIDPKRNKNNEQIISSVPSSQHEENNREKTTRKKPIETKVVISHRRDSSNSFSNVTEV